jgi:hypothetical protein
MLCVIIVALSKDKLVLELNNKLWGCLHMYDSPYDSPYDFICMQARWEFNSSSDTHYNGLYTHLSKEKKITWGTPWASNRTPNRTRNRTRVDGPKFELRYFILFVYFFREQKRLRHNRRAAATAAWLLPFAAVKHPTNRRLIPTVSQNILYTVSQNMLYFV